MTETTGAPASATAPVSDKGFVAAILLCFFLGGVHRFYVSKIGTGILMLIRVRLFLVDCYLSHS